VLYGVASCAVPDLFPPLSLYWNKEAVHQTKQNQTYQVNIDENHQGVESDALAICSSLRRVGGEGGRSGYAKASKDCFTLRS
jgi:hypothetical protein